MAVTDQAGRLPCGKRLEEILAQVADGAPAEDETHQAGCPYCQTALRRLRRAWTDVTDLAREPVNVPDGLTAQIMARVRVLAAQAADFILLGHPRGETRVSHAVVARIAQRLARTIPGVVFASARVEPRNPPLPDRVDLSIRLVVTFGPALHRVADAVRTIVRRQTPRLTGAQFDRIEIRIDDVTN
jgi:uncharacterized alkaline shock family protein YloU